MALRNGLEDRAYPGYTRTMKAFYHNQDDYPNDESIFDAAYEHEFFCIDSVLLNIHGVDICS